MSKTPGTVSKILWHFTGGPGWSVDQDKQSGKLKSPAKAFMALNSIVKSKQLKESSYPESVKAIVMRQINTDKIANKPTVHAAFEDRVETSSVVCVADIPVQHLNYHAGKYGKFAIGFKRESLIDYGFNPVMYTHNSSKVANNFVELINDLEFFRTGFAEYNKFTLEQFGKCPQEIVNALQFFGGEIGTPLGRMVGFGSTLSSEIDQIHDRVMKHASLLKTFQYSDMDSIFTEREWRLTARYYFEYHDIAMIVLPRKGGWFDRFVSEQHTLPRAIPIVPWEDLIEH